MGEKKANLILKNCNLLSVYTKEIIPKIQIAIINDRIAYVGPDSGHTLGPKTVVIDVKDKYVSPGFADPHLHIDQFMLPSEFSKKALLSGVTSLFSDPIDIVSVAGYKGFQEFLKLGEDLPIRIFQVVPGGLPVDAKFSNSKSLSLSQEKTAIKHPHVIGL
ncbi:MAG: amidohydrolase family protein, partial [Nitrosopumilus sp.]